MKTATAWIALFVVSTVVVMPAGAQDKPWGFAVFSEDGRKTLAAALRDEPYRSGVRPSVFTVLTGSSPVRSKSGKPISGVGFYGWANGSAVRVAVVSYESMTPESGLELFTTYTVKPGQTLVMKELKALGMKEVVLRTEAAPLR